MQSLASGMGFQPFVIILLGAHVCRLRNWGVESKPKIRSTWTPVVAQLDKGIKGSFDLVKCEQAPPSEEIAQTNGTAVSVLF